MIRIENVRRLAGGRVAADLIQNGKVLSGEIEYMLRQARERGLKIENEAEARREAARVRNAWATR